MDLPLTLTLAITLAALALFAGWRGARPPDFNRGPRLIPWRLLMLLCAAAMLVLLAHAANLVGVVTGRR